VALSKGSKAFLIALTGLLAVGAIVVGGAWWWVNQQVAGVPGEGDPVEVTIPEGSTASAIGSALEENDVIRNALAFRLVARSRGVDASFSSGTYELETGMSVDEALEALGAGPMEPERLQFTIPEGLTVAQTLARLDERTPHSEADYRQVLDAARADQAGGPLRFPDWVPSFSEFADDVEVFEGLLYPKTYDFDLEAEPAQILQAMLDQTEVAMASASPSGVTAAEEAGLTKYDALIIASLVEREARVPGEWREIATVILNRLEEPMRLQIDATLLYAAGSPDAGPAAVNTEVQSPYNTYQNDGLPPTPIAGARPEAIQAVFDPVESDFLFYVVAPECDGSHRFAETNEEHNQNAQAYREADRCAGDPDLEENVDEAGTEGE
jgi:UPF0755 protein